MSDTAFFERLQSYVGAEVGEPSKGPDPVNAPMIRHWCEAMGDTNPVYTDAALAAQSVHGALVAPPTMLQAWVMRGLGPGPSGRPANVYGELLNFLDANGFTSVVATNCEQEYERYLGPGDQLFMKTTIDAVSEEKATGLGVGHFVTTRQSYFDADGQPVGHMLFRILKFRPPAKAVPPDAAPPGASAKARPKRPRPMLTKDQEFFFAGAKEGKLLVQRCGVCGHLQYPPHAACQSCQSFEIEPAEVSGKGTVYSYVVTHHPQVAAFDYPLPVALIELAEGPRMISNLVDIDPADIRIGQPVEVSFVACDDDLTLPMFKVVS